MEPTPEAEAHGAQQPGPRGIGGWLIVPLLGMVATSIQTFISLLPVLRNLQKFIALWTGEVVSETPELLYPFSISLLLGIVLILYSIYCLIMIVRKSRISPRYMIVYYIFLILIAAFELSMAVRYEDYAATLRTVHDSWENLGYAVIGAVIWIPYFLLSERVKATFVL